MRVGWGIVLTLVLLVVTFGMTTFTGLPGPVRRYARSDLERVAAFLNHYDCKAAKVNLLKSRVDLEWDFFGLYHRLSESDKGMVDWSGGEAGCDLAAGRSGARRPTT